jgi:hypothetical protein
MADFDKTLDAADPNQVVPTRIEADGSADSSPLEIFLDGPGDANRLLVFTGIALVDVQFAEDDEILRRGRIRVRLNFPLSDAVKFISSATTASLSSIFSADDSDEATTFALDRVSTEPQPSDPNNPQSPLELVLTGDMAVQGANAGVSSIAYQANVLLQDSRPDIDHVLVRPAGQGQFGPEAIVEVGHPWDIEVFLTGPNPGPGPFPYTVSTSDPNIAPIAVLDSIQQVPPAATAAGKTMIDSVGAVPGSAVITVKGRTNVRTAKIDVIVVR